MEGKNELREAALAVMTEGKSKKDVPEHLWRRLQSLLPKLQGVVNTDPAQGKQLERELDKTLKLPKMKRGYTDKELRQACFDVITGTLPQTEAEAKYGMGPLLWTLLYCGKPWS